MKWGRGWRASGQNKKDFWVQVSTQLPVRPLKNPKKKERSINFYIFIIMVFHFIDYIVENSKIKNPPFRVFFKNDYLNFTFTLFGIPNANQIFDRVII